MSSWEPVSALIRMVTTISCAVSEWLTAVTWATTWSWREESMKQRLSLAVIAGPVVEVTPGAMIEVMPGTVVGLTPGVTG